MSPHQHVPANTAARPRRRSVWPFFAAALIFVIGGQIAFYVIAFSSGADLVEPGDDTVPGPPPPVLSVGTTATNAGDHAP